MILNDLGSQISFKKVFSISILSSFGKYLPGKVWSFSGFIYLMKKESVPIINSISTIIYVNAYDIIVGIILFFTIGFMKAYLLKNEYALK